MSASMLANSAGSEREPSSDGSLSEVFYKSDHVALTDELKAARAGINAQLSSTEKLPTPEAAAGAKQQSSGGEGSTTAAAGSARTRSGDSSPSMPRTPAEESYSPFRWLQRELERREGSPRIPRSMSESVFSELQRVEAAQEHPRPARR